MSQAPRENVQMRFKTSSEERVARMSPCNKNCKIKITDLHYLLHSAFTLSPVHLCKAAV